MEKKFFRTTAYVIVLLLVLLSAAANAVILFLPGVETVARLGCIPALLCCTFGLYYALRGFKKNAAAAYSVYLFFLGIVILHNCFVSSYTRSGNAAFGTVFLAVAFACVFTLLVAKDLGRKKSLWLISVSLAVQWIVFLIPTVLRADALSGGDLQYAADVFRTLGAVWMNLLGLALVVQKYADKAERGTK